MKTFKKREADMRLAICTLSAVLLSGCSWLGLGSGQSNGYAAGGAYGADCVPNGQFGAYGHGHGAYGQAGGCQGGAYGYGAGQGGAWGANGYGAGANGAGFGAYGPGAGAYGAGGGAYGAGAYGPGAGAYGAGGAGYGAGGAYGAGAGVGGGAYGAGPGAGGAYGQGGVYGQGGAYGTGAGAAYTNGYATGYGQGTGAYGPGAGVGFDGAGGPVLLGQGSSFGSAVGTVGGGQFAQFAPAGGQVLGQGAAIAGVQQIQGAPIYVPQPFPAYYQAPRLRVGGAAQPLGLALFGGTSTFNDGNIFDGEDAKPAGTSGRSVSALDAISYEDAFGDGETYGGALEYDLDRNNTVFVSASRTEYEGQSLTNGTITQDNTAAGGTVHTDDGQYEFSDLNETRLEAGLRHYVGGNGALRPYVSGSAGFVHNNRVHLTTTTADTNVVAAPETIEYIREGWQPTAAGLIGAELAVGHNAALGVETGIRWTDDRATNLKTEDSFSVPVQIRGRLAF